MLYTLVFGTSIIQFIRHKGSTHHTSGEGRQRAAVIQRKSENINFDLWPDNEMCVTVQRIRNEWMNG